jgi:hypothetical protein
LAPGVVDLTLMAFSRAQTIELEILVTDSYFHPSLIFLGEALAMMTFDSEKHTSFLHLAVIKFYMTSLSKLTLDNESNAKVLP